MEVERIKRLCLHVKKMKWRNGPFSTSPALIHNSPAASRLQESTEQGVGGIGF